MRTNLIIVEGLPGSGKSTAAAMIAKVLAEKGKKAVCVDEGAQEHPADYADYDFPDFETERRKILGKWRSFWSAPIKIRSMFLTVFFCRIRCVKP